MLFNAQGAFANGVDEVTVMGNHHQCALITAQPALQPEHGIQVQVVGRLIQQQDIRGCHQRPGQIEPDAPAAGKIYNGLFQVVGGETQTQQQLFRPAGCAVTVDGFQGLVQLCGPLEILRALRSGNVDEQCGYFPVAGDYEVPG